MIFTEALRKEVFGPVGKNPKLAGAKIVERTGLANQVTTAANVLKAANTIAALHDKQKPQ